jgi:methylenetetrahydrofolate reductase (NADPH)
LSVIPKTFKVDLPKELVSEALKVHSDEEMKQLGIEWGIQQCKELIQAGVPSLHFYALGATESVMGIAKGIY